MNKYYNWIASFLVIIVSVYTLDYLYQINEQALENYSKAQIHSIGEVLETEDHHVQKAFSRLAHRYFNNPKEVQHDASEYLNDFKFLYNISTYDSTWTILQDFNKGLETPKVSSACINESQNSELKAVICTQVHNGTPYSFYIFKQIMPSRGMTYVVFNINVVELVSGVVSNFNTNLLFKFTKNQKTLYSDEAYQQAIKKTSEQRLSLRFIDSLDVTTSVNKTTNALYHNKSSYILIILFGLFLVLFIVFVTQKLSQEQALRIKMEEKEKEAISANAAKSSFLANVSHEIRTPLNGIIGMSQVLSMKSLDRETLDEIHYIYKSGKWLLSLINDLLDFAKIESGNMTLEYSEFQVQQFVNDIQRMYQPRVEGTPLKFIVKDESIKDLYLRSDEIKLKQVLINLLGNALKFTPSGSITLELKYAQDLEKQSLHFSVKDTGKGISQQALQTIFSEFKQEDNTITRKFGGTGLGLSISKRIVEALGAELEVKSQLNQGSEFYFTLTFAADHSSLFLKESTNSNAGVESPSSHLNQTPLNGLKILLAEDNIVNQKVASKMLTKLGAHCEIAQNGLEVEEFIQEGKSFDLVLLDIQMPLQDGITTLQHIRDPYSKVFVENLPIIVLSANAGKEDIQSSLDQGANAYLTKPFDIHLLKDKILALCGSNAN